MNNAQKGSPHLQFAHSSHRQRVISLVIPSGILLERVQSAFDTPLEDYPDFTGLTENIGRVVGTETKYETATIQTPNTLWLWTPNTPGYTMCGPSDRGTSGLYSGAGIVCIDDKEVPVFGQMFSKMRIHWPAVGVVGIYRNLNYSDFTLESSVSINHISGSTEIIGAAPGAAAGEHRMTISMFFFGITAASLPATIAFDSWANSFEF